MGLGCNARALTTDNLFQENCPIATEIRSRRPRRNFEIRVPKVRVLGVDGSQIGVMTRDEALRMADEAGLDLVEISPNADPPVCSIIEYGKYLFDLKQKEKAAKKHQKRIEIKELKFRPSTDEGDYQVKLRSLRRFIAEGDKVKVNIRFRGREMAHQELGRAMAQRIAADLKEEATVEQHPRLEGKQMILMLAPKKR